MNGVDRRLPKVAYVHIPFCRSRCGYCDFNSYAGLEELHDRYVGALVSEIARTADAVQPAPELETVYLGGGTPTVLSVNNLAVIAKALRSAFGFAPDAEITLEANPGTVDWPMLARLPAAGFNRISIGVQSFNDEHLAVLGRIHSARQAVEAFRMARQTGWRNVGIDLMYAVPGQRLSDWRADLGAAVELGPEHISLYELTIEPGTAFAEHPELFSGYPLPDEDVRLQMYELAVRFLTDAGFEHYEVSNFARPGFRSRHNQVYWRREPCYAFGAGAVSFVDGVRARRVAHPRDYIECIAAGSDAVEASEKLTGRAALGEAIALGLRMVDGIELDRLIENTGYDPLLEFSEQIRRLEERGLIVLENGSLKTTHAGLLVLDDVAREFVISPTGPS